MHLEFHFLMDTFHAQMMNLMQCLVLSRNVHYNDWMWLYHVHTKHHDFRVAELKHLNPELALHWVDAGAGVVAVEM